MPCINLNPNIDNLSGCLPEVSRIERINAGSLEEKELKKYEKLLREELSPQKEIADVINIIREMRKDTRNDSEGGEKRLFESLSNIVDQIERCEKGAVNSKNELRDLINRAYKTNEIVSAFNKAFEQSERYYKGTERDLNNDEGAREIYEDLKNAVENLRQNLMRVPKELKGFITGYYESCQEIDNVINVKIETVRQLNDVIDNNIITISSGEEKEKGYNYESIQGIGEETEQTLGRKTVQLKYPGILSCLSSIEGVEVEIKGFEDKDKIVAPILTDSGYRGIKFKYNNQEYVALVANKYGDAMYFLPFLTFNEHQSRLTKALMKDIHAIKKNWKITDKDTQVVREIINNNLDSIQNISDVRDVPNNLASKLYFLINNEGIEEVIREIAKYFEGSVKGVLQRLNEENS